MADFREVDGGRAAVSHGVSLVEGVPDGTLEETDAGAGGVAAGRRIGQIGPGGTAWLAEACRVIGRGRLDPGVGLVEIYR